MSERIRDLNVETTSVSALTPYVGNPRTHSKKQIRQIADSIEEFGWANPILVDGNDGVIAGHGRLAAAKLLKLEAVPTIRIDDISEAQKRAYIVADNKLAENAGWDRDLVRLELQGLVELDGAFDVTLTGFEVGEVDVLIAEGVVSDDDADLMPQVDPTKPLVTQLGDLWQLGQHRLLCGDALKAESHARLLNGELAQMVFTDPPYNVPVDGHVCGLGAVKHAEFAMAAGEMSEVEFTTFLATVLGNLAAYSVDGAIQFVCMDWRHVYELLAAGRQAYDELKNLCVWNKTNGGMGSLYHSKHELVAVFKAGRAVHINNVALGANGRYRTNVWDYAGINSFGGGRDEALAMHPTVKPVALVADAIKDCSKHARIVLDAFGGSGTTIIAAEKTSRRGYALELDPRYVDVTIERWQQLTGNDAIHMPSGLTFDELK